MRIRTLRAAHGIEIIAFNSACKSLSMIGMKIDAYVGPSLCIRDSLGMMFVAHRRYRALNAQLHLHIRYVKLRNDLIFNGTID